MRRQSGADISYTVATDSQLLQEYLKTSGILMSQTAANPIAAFQSPEGQTEAIVIDPGGSLYHACREPLSDSGWNVYGIGAGFQAIAAVDAQTAWAVGNNGALWRSDRGRWTRAETLPSDNPAVGVSAGTDGTIWATDTSGALYARNPSLSRNGPTIASSIAPVLLTDANGLLNLFCVDVRGRLWTVLQLVAGGGWGPWQNLAAPSAEIGLTRIAVGENQDGRLQVFAIGSDATPHTIWQQGPGGGWSAWGTLSPDPPTVSTLAVAQNHDGRLEVFVLSPPDDSGNVALVHNWQTVANNGWNGWSALALPQSGQWMTDLAAVRDANGCLEVVVVGAAGQSAQWATQTGPGQDWAPWESVGQTIAVALSSPALMVNEDGDLEVLALGSDGTVWDLGQRNGVWEPGWISLSSPGPGLAGLVVAKNADGRLEAFAAMNGAIQHIWQAIPGEYWSSWASLGAPTGQSLAVAAVALNPAGALEILAADGRNSAWRISQDPSANPGWSGWVADWSPWVPIAGAPALAGMPGGTSGNFWAVDSSGALVNWSGEWSPGQTLPDGAAAACLAVDVEGTAWILAADPAGTFYRMAGGAPEALPGGLPGARSIGVGSASTIRATVAGAPSTAFGLYAYRAGAWQDAAAPPLNGMDWNNFPQVAVARDGTAWLLDGSGTIWKHVMVVPRWNWDACPPPAGVSFACVAAGLGGAAWAVDTGGTMWTFNGAWVPFNHPVPGATVAQVSPGTLGTLWAIDTGGIPYSYSDSSGSWQQIESSFGGPLVESPTSWALQTEAAFQYNPAPENLWLCLDRWATGKIGKQISVGIDGTVAVLYTDGTLAILAGAGALAVAPPGNLVSIGVVSATSAWGIAQASDGGPYALHLYADAAWAPVVTSGNWLAAGGVVPRLSASSDGTVWLLDTSGVPRRLTWSPAATTWTAKGKATSFRSVAAANVDVTSITTPDAHEAWAISADGAFRRSIGNGWSDVHAALPGGATPAQVSVGSDGSVWAIDAQGRLYARRPSSQSPAPSEGGRGVMTARQDGSGLLHLFSLDSSGQAWVTSHDSAAGLWLDWAPLSSPEPLTTAIAGLDQDGTLEFFCLAGSGVAYHAWQDGGSSTGWSSFTALGTAGQPSGVALSCLVTGRDQAGLLHVVALGTDNSVWFVKQQSGAASGWTDWTALPSFGGGTLLALATGNDPGGQLEIFGLANTGIAWHSWQDPQSPSGWSDWWVLGATGQPPGITLKALAAGNGQGGPLHVFGTGSDGAVYAINGQPSSPTGWSDWSSLGAIAGVQPLALETGTGAGGAFFVFMQGSDGAIYNAALAQGSADWSPWAPLGAMGTRGAPMHGVAAGTDETGGVHVFAPGGGSVWQTVPQASSATGWSDWGRLSGRQPWTATGAQNLGQAPVGSSGGLWAVFRDGSLGTSADGSTWATVPFPNSAAPAAAVSVSTGADGRVWAITATQCYWYDTTCRAWTAAGAGGFAQAPVGSTVDLWTVDLTGNVLRSGDGGFTWRPETSYAGAARQLSICADGSVWALGADGVVSLAMGWTRVMRPTGMPGFAGYPPATEVVAGQDEDGTRCVFAVFNGQLSYTYELARHAWPQFTRLDPAVVSGIGLTNQQDTGTLIVYAPPTDGAIRYATRAPGQLYQFTLSTFYPFAAGTPDGPLVSATLDLSAIDGDAWCWFSPSDGTILASTTAALPASATFIPLAPSPPIVAARVLPLPWPRSASSPYCAVLDEAEQIWLVGTDGACVPLTGSNTAIPSGAASVAPVLQADAWAPPQRRLYVLAKQTQVGADATLWMLGQTNLFAAAPSPSAWSAWIPLGGDYTALAGGPALAPADTLFGIDDATGCLGALRQNRSTGKWTDGLVNRPSQSASDIVTVPMYQTEATLRDGNGVPAPGVPVTIFADAPVEAWVNNTLHALDPVHGVTVSTSVLGQLNIKTLATGLHTPQLSFHAEGLNGAGPIPGRFGTSGVSIAPSQHVYDFLGGKGRLPVGGGPPRCITAPSVLQGLNPSLSSADAGTVVTDLGAITTMPGGLRAGAGGALLRRHLADGAPGGVFSHLWHDIKHAAEAIAHAIEQGVVSAAIDVAGDVVTLTLSIGGALVTAFDMAIVTIEDAVRAIEMVVEKFVAALEDFVRWLTLLFDWKNILTTQRSLRTLVEAAIGVLQQQMETVEREVASVFSGIQDKVTSAFGSITSDILGDHATFGSLPKQVPNGSASAPRLGSLSDADPPPVAGSSSVHHNWFMTKVLDHITPSFSVAAIPGLDLGALLGALDLHTAIGKIHQSGQDVLAFFKVLVEDPTEFARKGLVDMLGAFEALVSALLDLVEAVIEAFLGLMQTILAGALAALESAVEIPGIDELFAFLTGEDMTALNLATLVTAVPLYILYEIAFGGLPLAGLDFGPGAASGTTTKEQLANLFCILGTISWFVSLLLNVLTVGLTPEGDPNDLPDITPFLAIFNIMVALGMQVAAWPDPSGFPTIPQTVTSPQVWIWLNYALFWIPPLIGLAAIPGPNVKKALDPDIKNLIDVTVGSLAMGSAVVAVMDMIADPPLLNPPGLAALLVRPVSRSLNFLLIRPIRQAVYTATDFPIDPAAGKLLVDLITLLAGPILKSVSASLPGEIDRPQPA